MTGTDGSLALDNLEAVLTAGDMTLADVVRLNVYTTGVDDAPQLLALVEGEHSRLTARPACDQEACARPRRPTG